MLTMLVPIITVVSHQAHEWLPEATAALHLGAAALNFSIAIHRAARYWRSDRKR
ncbi:hypothetical protein [Microbispora sp. CA-102843]|uniref:hypothetical protein n=1 Tax=Microbispora sp. CA-102843 TaxID=3239952 RepID=UPI003D90AB2F